MREHIFLLAIEGTGSKFIEDLLLSHEDVGNYPNFHTSPSADEDSLCSAWHHDRDRIRGFATHQSIEAGLEDMVPQNFSTCLFYDHFNPWSLLRFLYEKKLIDEPPMITVRHPYDWSRTMVSRGYDLRAFLLNYLALVRFASVTESVIMPIDLLGENPVDIRIRKFKDWFAFLSPLPDNLLQKITEWKPVNETPTGLLSPLQFKEVLNRSGIFELLQDLDVFYKR